MPLGVDYPPISPHPRLASDRSFVTDASKELYGDISSQRQSRQVTYHQSRASFKTKLIVTLSSLIALILVLGFGLGLSTLLS